MAPAPFKEIHSPTWFLVCHFYCRCYSVYTIVMLERFNLTAFKPWQKRAMESIIQKRDVLIAYPRGSGKSLYFQFPAVWCKKTVIVITPTVSLMCDQTTLLAYNIVATYLGTAQQDKAIEAKILAGEHEIVFVTPETFFSDDGSLQQLFQQLQGTIEWPWLLWISTPTQRMENIQSNTCIHSFMHTLTTYSSIYTHAWHTLRHMHTHTQTHIIVQDADYITWPLPWSSCDGSYCNSYISCQKGDTKYLNKSTWGNLIGQQTKHISFSCEDWTSPQE